MMAAVESSGGGVDSTSKTVLDVQEEEGTGDSWEGRHDQDDEYAQEEIDPRVEQTLEAMNEASDNINLFESKLEETKRSFKQTMQQYDTNIKKMGSKLGRRKIDKARLYHDAMSIARKAHIQSRRWALQYQKVSQMYSKAKARVASCEKKFESGAAFDANLQTELNEASDACSRTAANRKTAEDNYQKQLQAYWKADEEVMKLAKMHKSVILQTKEYFDSVYRYRAKMNRLQRDILQWQEKLAEAKLSYNNCLAMLEEISQEIHARREQAAAVRDTGKGASEELQLHTRRDRLSEEIAKARTMDVAQQARAVELEQDTKRLLEEAGIHGEGDSDEDEAALAREEREMEEKALQESPSSEHAATNNDVTVDGEVVGNVPDSTCDQEEQVEQPQVPIDEKEEQFEEQNSQQDPDEVGQQQKEQEQQAELDETQEQVAEE
eukprot:m.11912 g.11912  ORF g.11912 m.11912 type:complete len:437 (-) comp5779_c0_seq1:176-1486(-)